MLPIYMSMISTEDKKSKFELLYTAYRKLMFFVAKQVLRDDHLAEDATHQTFVKIIEILDKIGDVHCPKTKGLVVIMVRNTAINVYNRRKRSNMIVFEHVNDRLADENETLCRIEEVDCLTRAVMMLPTTHKEVLTLKYVHELSSREIAQLLGASETTVRKRLERARCKLREALEMEGSAGVI